LLYSSVCLHLAVVMRACAITFLAAVAIPFSGALRNGGGLDSNVFAAVNTSNSASTQVTIRVFWIRHGVSCANIIRQFSLTGIVSQHSYADPGLINCAVELAQKLGPKIRGAVEAEATKVGWAGPVTVFSSPLVRAMETALYNFPDEKVYPIPYISEHGGEKDNTPVPWYIPNKEDDEQDQKESKLPREPNDAATIARLTFVPGVNDPDDPDRDGEYKDDYDMFKIQFPKILAALLPEDQIVPGATIPVVVYTHSTYMKNNVKCDGSRKPRNNEVWVQDYDVNLVTPEDPSVPVKQRVAPAMVESGGCQPAPFEESVFPIYKGQKGSFGRKYPCEIDMERCSKSNPWMPDLIEGVSCCPSVD